jgi:hypothetical protein
LSNRAIYNSGNYLEFIYKVPFLSAQPLILRYLRRSVSPKSAHTAGSKRAGIWVVWPDLTTLTRKNEVIKGLYSGPIPEVLKPLPLRYRSVSGFLAGQPEIDSDLSSCGRRLNHSQIKMDKCSGFWEGCSGIADQCIETVDRSVCEKSVPLQRRGSPDSFANAYEKQSP